MAGMVDLEVADGIARVTLRNEQHRNAITVALADALVEACDRIDGRPDVGATVITGAGGYFCAGGDRDELAEICSDPATDEHIEMTQRIYDAFLRFGALRPVTLAAIRGGCLGAGLNLALAADLRLVSTEARISSGFTLLRVHPGGGHYGLLARAAGTQAATALGLLGQTIDGKRAVELGLAWEAQPDDQVEVRATELAVVAARDPDLARRAKTSLRLQADPPGLDWQASVQVERAPQMWSFARKSEHGWWPDKAIG